MPVHIGELEISPAPAPAATGAPPAAAASGAAQDESGRSDPARLAAARRVQTSQRELTLRVFAH